jgi:hypothetical protein
MNRGAIFFRPLSINMFLNLPKKFWWHCVKMLEVVGGLTIMQSVIDGLHQLFPFEHYLLITVCVYSAIALSIIWFVWRAYICMERDLDFYEDEECH